MAGIVKSLQFAEGVVVAAPTVSGSGAGEKNYITSQSNASDWAAVGDLDVTTTTTAAELPREYTTGSGIKITADANTQSVADYVYYDFTLDDVDLNKKLKIQWSQKTAGTYAAGDLAVVITTQADRTTAVATPITTAIPAADGVFTTSFDTSSTATLSLVIRATTDMATNGGIVISDVVVGPGTQPQGAVVSGWTSYTPTYAGLGTVTTVGSEWRRVGEVMQVRGRATLGTTTGSTATLSLPSGYTTRLPSANNYIVGTLAASGTNKQYFATVGNAATVVFFNRQGDDAFTSSGAVGTTVGASGESISWDFEVPIAEWAGSGTLNVAQNDVTYISHNGTSIVYGPAGALIPAGTPSGSTETYSIQTAIDAIGFQPATDCLIFEMQETAADAWNTGATPSIDAFRYDGTNYIGAGVRSNSGIVLIKGKYAQGTSSSWGTPTTRWRVRVAKGGQAVGFGEASLTSLGLIKPGHTALSTTATAYSAATSLVRSGTFTPAFTGTTNISSITADAMVWSQVGRVVTCSGYVLVTATSGSAGSPVQTAFTLTLPVTPTTNFSSLNEVSGTFCQQPTTGVSYDPGIVQATTSAKTATVTFGTTTTGSGRACTYTFQYLVN